jgi:hypothetical protein
MDAAQVEFRHYRVEFSDDVLSRFGSRYFTRNEAGKQLRTWLLEHVKGPQYATSLEFSAAQLTCANEVFPEAALADPIADLEVWDEWRSGLRRFPYPGVYTRLNILRQEKKTSATSSVGVLGEIFAGLLSQSYVAPLVVVRPIRHWPDFIYLSADQRYSFVESKASASLDGPRPPGIEGVPEDLLAEGLVDAVQELNAESFLRVWLVFTDIWAVQPVQANVCVLETETPSTRRSGRSLRIPDAVIDGLAERLLLASAAELEPEFEEVAQMTSDAEEKQARRELWELLRDRAMTHAREVVPTSVPEDYQSDAVDAIRERIRATRTHKGIVASSEGRRLTDAKRTAVGGKLAGLRRLAGGACLMLADLDSSDLVRVHQSWKADWSRASRPWRYMEDLPLWRCSSAILGVGGNEYEGKDVSEAR